MIQESALADKEHTVNHGPSAGVLARFLMAVRVPPELRQPPLVLHWQTGPDLFGASHRVELVWTASRLCLSRQQVHASPHADPSADDMPGRSPGIADVVPVWQVTAAQGKQGRWRLVEATGTLADPTDDVVTLSSVLGRAQYEVRRLAIPYAVMSVDRLETASPLVQAPAGRASKPSSPGR